MKRYSLVFIFMLFSSCLLAQDKLKSIQGLVTLEEQPQANVSVVIKGTNRGVLTSESGRYVIQVKNGEVLVFSFVGLQTEEFRVENTTIAIDVALRLKLEALDEVVVKKKKRPSQKDLLAQYPLNKNLIKTSFGIIDKDRVSFSIKIIEGKDILPIGSDFLYALQNVFPQMVVNREIPLDVKVYLQKNSYNAIPQAVFDVDGFIFEKPPTFLSATDIVRMAILLRNGAVARYGPAGAGGVVIINTKKQHQMDVLGAKRTYDHSKLRDSIQKVLQGQSPLK